MATEFVCMRCQFREPGWHACEDRACTCCYGEEETFGPYDLDGGCPYFITVNADPPHPPYRLPEEAGDG